MKPPNTSRGASVARRRLLAGSALVLAVTALLVEPRAAHSAPPRARRAPSPAVANAVTTTTSAPASRPKTLTLVTDSVTLGAVSALRADLPGWHVEVLGKPALMIKQAVPLYLPPGRRVGSVVVVGLGYNSLWQRNRVNFNVWANQFDREADALVAQLRSRGAKKIVWVTLREPSPGLVTPDDHFQYSHYAWFFPYVNERLRALVRRQPDIALADWAAVSDRGGVTYDLIHLDPQGARLMASAIITAINA